MKKLLAVMIALAMLLSAAALAEAADYTGMWYLNQMESEGMVYAPADFGITMSLELKEDGTAVSTQGQGDQSETGEGTWTIEDEGIAVTIDDATESFVLEDGSLIGEADDMKMTFGREPVEVEVFVPAEPKADAAVEDYAGNWVAFKIDTGEAYVDTALLSGQEFDMSVAAAIEGTTITINGIVFNDEVVEAEFADGALTFAAEKPDEVMLAGVQAQLLEDDTMRMTLTIADDMSFIMQRAE